MARVRAGAEIIIDSDTHPAAVLGATEPPRRSISESIALGEARTKELGYKPVMDAGLAADLGEIIRNRKPRDTSVSEGHFGPDPRYQHPDRKRPARRRRRRYPPQGAGRARRDRCRVLGFLSDRSIQLSQRRIQSVQYLQIKERLAISISSITWMSSRSASFAGDLTVEANSFSAPLSKLWPSIL